MSACSCSVWHTSARTQISCQLFGTFQHFSAGQPEEKFRQVKQVTQVEKFVNNFISSLLMPTTSAKSPPPHFSIDAARDIGDDEQNCKEDGGNDFRDDDCMPEISSPTASCPNTSAHALYAPAPRADFPHCAIHGCHR